MTAIEMPNYEHYPKKHKGRLLSDYQINIPLHGYNIDTKYVNLSPCGSLVVKCFYMWDYGSGPAIDTPGMVYASLVHDTLYQLIREGLIPSFEKETADKLFLKMLKDAGVGWFRRRYCYLAVSIFGKFWT